MYKVTNSLHIVGLIFTPYFKAFLAGASSVGFRSWRYLLAFIKQAVEMYISDAKSWVGLIKVERVKY